MEPAPGRSRTFRSLANLNFRRFFIGQAVSQIGTWMQMVAAGILVLQITDSGVALGLMAAAQFGPTLVFGAWAGVLCDRLDRHHMLLVVNAVGAVVGTAFAVAVVAGTESVALIFLLSLLAGTVNAFESPARRAFVTDLVGEELIQNATGLNSTVMTGAKVVGPALAGVLIAGAGMSWCFVLNAISFGPQLVLFLAIDRSKLHQGERPRLARGQLREGLSYTWRTPELRRPLLLLVALGIFGFNAHPVVLPLLATRDLAGDASTYTLLFATMSLGSVLGALANARRADTDTRFLTRMAAAFGVANLALALAPGLWVAALLTLPVGYTMLMTVSGTNAAVQLAASPAMRGRVLALVSMVFVGSGPIGGPIIGWVAEAAGARAALFLGGGVSLVAALVMLSRLPAREPARVTMEETVPRSHPGPPLPRPTGGAPTDLTGAGAGAAPRLAVAALPTSDLSGPQDPAEFYDEVLSELCRHWASASPAGDAPSAPMGERELIEWLSFRAWYERQAACLSASWLQELGSREMSAVDEEVFFAVSKQVADEGAHFHLFHRHLCELGGSLDGWRPEPESLAWAAHLHAGGADTLERVAAHSLSGEIGTLRTFERVIPRLPAATRLVVAQVVPDIRFHVSTGRRVVRGYCTTAAGQERFRGLAREVGELETSSRRAFGRRLARLAAA